MTYIYHIQCRRRAGLKKPVWGLCARRDNPIRTISLSTRLRLPSKSEPSKRCLTNERPTPSASQSSKGDRTTYRINFRSGVVVAFGFEKDRFEAFAVRSSTPGLSPNLGGAFVGRPSSSGRPPPRAHLGLENGKGNIRFQTRR